MSEINGLMPKISKEVTGKLGCNNDQLEIIEEFKTLIDSGRMSDFIIIGRDQDSQLVLAATTDDLIGNLGLLEICKFTFLNQQGDE
jgi:hypothetical protein